MEFLAQNEWAERTGCGSGLPTPVGQSYSYLPSRKHTYLLERAHPTRGCADREGDFSQGQPDAQVQGPTTTLFTTCVLNPLLCIEPELHSRRHVRTLWGARD